MDFATLAEPTNTREYVFVHHQLGLHAGDRLLDMACGSGLALELAQAVGATCCGIDASPRLAAVASDRVPGGDVRVGDMGALPWDDETFDIVTSFRGIWGTTPTAVAEAFRVLCPGGRLAMTVWGNVGKSDGAWMFAPFQWAEEPKLRHQAEMVSLGRPGVGEAFLTDSGFDVAPRVEVPYVIEYADPETFARGIASTGPAYESIQAIGEAEFHRRAVALASDRMRDGLPLRGSIQLFGYIATKPSSPS